MPARISARVSGSCTRAEVDRADLGGEVRVELLEGQGIAALRRGGSGYWMTECGVASRRVTLICSRSIMLPTLGEISFFQ